MRVGRLPGAEGRSGLPAVKNRKRRGSHNGLCGALQGSVNSRGAAKVKAGRRPPPKAARSDLDGSEHGAKIRQARDEVTGAYIIARHIKRVPLSPIPPA